MKNNKIAVIIFYNVLFALTASAQGEKEFIRQRVETLASPEFHGRGYVMGGGEAAAQYIAGEFRSYGLKPIRQNGSFFQEYEFPVNTYPGEMRVEIDGKKLRPGVDFIINAASMGGYTEKPVRMKTIDLSGVKDSALWDKVRLNLDPGKAYFLKGADTPTKYLNLGIRNFARQFPPGLFIVPKHGKLIWTANTNREFGTIIYVEDTVISARPRKVHIAIDNQYLENYRAKNIIGYVPGTEKPDSFVVFTAHADHLGRMGKEALFPGASDNASGTSLVLYLANYFAQHPQRYSVAFMLFTGEEAGLLGSKYYTEHPLFPMKQIRFLVNLDMAGDATKGITVVNGVSHEPEFALLEELNDKNKYAVKIHKRERTSNSDHYHFSKNGVPAVFIYGNGTNGHYHDVFDVAGDLNLQNVDGLARLLIDFTGTISGTKKQ